jgi:hypothetical protein
VNGCSQITDTSDWGQGFFRTDSQCVLPFLLYTAAQGICLNTTKNKQRARRRRPRPRTTTHGVPLGRGAGPDPRPSGRCCSFSNRDRYAIIAAVPLCTPCLRSRSARGLLFVLLSCATCTRGCSNCVVDGNENALPAGERLSGLGLGEGSMLFMLQHAVPNTEPWCWTVRA